MRDRPLGFDLLIFTELHDITPGEGLRSCMNLYVFELPCSVRIGEIWTKVHARIISQCKPSSKKELDPAIFPNTVKQVEKSSYIMRCFKHPADNSMRRCDPFTVQRASVQIKLKFQSPS